MENIRSWIPELKPAGQWFVSAILGGAVVALMDQYFAVQLEQDKRLMDLRKSAYTDFFVGQSARRLVGAGVYETKVTESRFLIGVYGSRPTVEALAAYYNFHFRETDKNDSKNVLNEPDKDSNEPKKDPNGAKEGSYRTKKPEVIGFCKGSRTKWIDDIRIYQRMRDELFGGGLFQTALPFLYRSHLLDDATMVLVIHNCRLPAK